MKPWQENQRKLNVVKPWQEEINMMLHCSTIETPLARVDRIGKLCPLNLTRIMRFLKPTSLRHGQLVRSSD